MQILDKLITWVRSGNAPRRPPHVDDYDYELLQDKADQTGERQVVQLSTGMKLVVKPKKEEKAKASVNGRFSAESW
jgi:hypothetical protein